MESESRGKASEAGVTSEIYCCDHHDDRNENPRVVDRMTSCFPEFCKLSRFFSDNRTAYSIVGETIVRNFDRRGETRETNSEARELLGLM